MSDRLRIKPFLQLAIDKAASDIYFSVHAPMMMRVECRTCPIKSAEGSVLTPERVEQLALDVMSEEQRAEFEVGRAGTRLRLSLRHTGRFRANVFRQRGSVAMVLRNIGRVPAIDDLDMPDVLKRLALLKRGLVLVVGATGSGKSTLPPTRPGQSSQRECRRPYPHHRGSGRVHAPAQALHRQPAGNRQRYPQLRPRPAFGHARGPGHGAGRRNPRFRNRQRLCATGRQWLFDRGHPLHAANAYQCLQGLVSLFPASRRESLYMDLSINLRAIVPKRLVAARQGGRLAVYKILLNTAYIADLILHGRSDWVAEALAQADPNSGAGSFDDPLLAALVKAGLLAVEEALDQADSRDNLQGGLAFASR